MAILRNQIAANQHPIVPCDSAQILYDLPQFSGVAEDWPLFIANFKDTTNMYKYSNRQNLMRLQKCLQGQARVAMRIKPFPSIIDFSDWLSDTAIIVSLMPSISSQIVQPKPMMVIDKTKKVQCVICKDDHSIVKCKEFENMPLSTRWEKVKQLKLSFSCLHKGHGTAVCRNKKSCGIEDCRKNHHKILHGSNRLTSEVLPTQNQGDSNSLQPILNCRTQQASIFFKILPVTIYGPAGCFKVFAMFDEGSSISLIAEETAKQLGIKRKPFPLTLQWYGDEVVTEKSFNVQFEIKGCLNTTQTQNTTNGEMCLRKQWRIAQHLKDRLWKRWIKEYLPQLLCRSKWLEEAEPLKADDVVLICDSSTPRHKWHKGFENLSSKGRSGSIRGFKNIKWSTSTSCIKASCIKGES
ncbi:hypothetical protein CVS40_11135 [Lucilia cuprina]|nr:hypothetical protein CVS40_11135 [Lucilia cuprina]